MEQPAGSRLVVYRNGSFSPDRLDVGPGDIVAFVNESDSAMWPASNIHPTHEILSEFDAGKLVAPGGFWRYHNHLLFSSSGLAVVSGSGAIRSPPIVLLELPEFQTLDVATLKDAADLFEYDDALDATSRNTGRHAQSGSCLKAQRH